MAFIHQGNIDAAKRIFDFFQSRITNPFPGFRQAWDPCNGQPINDPNNPYWEGDNAFLLLALNYYAQVTSSYGSYDNLANALRGWLTERANSCDTIVAEGVANMYAALVPVGSDQSNWQTLSKLYRCFFTQVKYTLVSDHIVRGALVFGDTTGFNSLSDFKRTETWQYNESTVIQAYAAFSSEDFINVEISAQLLVAWELWRHELNVDLAPLRSELEKLRLPSQQNPMCSGLPYLVRHPNSGGFTGDYSLPIADPTVYLLYAYWNFNPFAPGRTHAGCRYGRFVPLVTEGQQQGFPRLFNADQDPVSQFPQEINNGNHKQIIIEFTTARALSQIPITLTVDTVGRDSSFQMSVKLDDGNHCLDVCDRNKTYVNAGEFGTVVLDDICNRTFLPLLAKDVTARMSLQPSVSTSNHNYQLVLEGTSGWGVFDWLQLTIPGEVLWTIGNKDNRCSEFDNSGFTFPCN
jgi:hypothetical protein